jgi:hypothetical protein
MRTVFILKQKLDKINDTNYMYWKLVDVPADKEAVFTRDWEFVKRKGNVDAYQRRLPI